MGISDYKAAAWNTLWNDNWGYSILAFFIYATVCSAAIGIIFFPFYIIIGIASGIAGLGLENEMNNNPAVVVSMILFVYLFVGVLMILSKFILAPMQFGINYFYRRMVNEGDKDLMNIFSGLKIYLKTVKAIFIMGIFTTLWSMLFVIPGIIAAYRYSQTIFIILDNPEIGVMDAIKESTYLMDGSKMEFFLLHLSFIGWIILATITCGLLYYALCPYVMVTNVHFYNNLKVVKPTLQNVGYNG